MAEPDTNLGVGSGTHAWQTGEMLMRIEKVLLAEKPDWVLVYGDTNSTLAGALASAKLRIPLAHVEAGLRSFNREMPEEHNRVLTDHCSDLLFCPTQTAVDNLQKEGFRNIINDGKLLDESFFENRLSALPAPWNSKTIPLGSFELSPLVVNVGDTMYDAVLQFSEVAKKHSDILQNLGLNKTGYLLATLHRPYNTDVPENLSSILAGFLEIGEPIVFSVHPRTQQKIATLDNPLRSQLENSQIQLLDPIGYLDMLVLEQNARVILTDSGGMQKEAYFFGVPCVTLRPETEWVETVEAGWNVLVGSDSSLILEKTPTMQVPPQSQRQVFGDGHASQLIVEILKNSTQA